MAFLECFAMRRFYHDALVIPSVVVTWMMPYSKQSTSWSESWFQFSLAVTTKDQCKSCWWFSWWLIFSVERFRPRQRHSTQWWYNTPAGAMGVKNAEVARSTGLFTHTTLAYQIEHFSDWVSSQVWYGCVQRKHQENVKLIHVYHYLRSGEIVMAITCILHANILR